MKAQEILNPLTKRKSFSGLCALGIMTKAPQAGRVKTRLTPPLTPAEAAALNVCFLRDLSNSIVVAGQSSPAQGVGIYTPVGSEGAYANILPGPFVLLLQRGEGFGERLGLAVEDLLAVGFESVCLINSDSPTVPASSFAEAANELAKRGDKIVLGPSEDGGYFLIGMKQLHRRLFEEIAWSTEHVFEQTLLRAGEAGVAVHTLPRGFDVDDNATLQRLCRELFENEAQRNVAPHTRKFLSEIIQREGRDRIWPKT